MTSMDLLLELLRQQQGQGVTAGLWALPAVHPGHISWPSHPVPLAPALPSRAQLHQGWADPTD